jgi:hypothetical protein
VSHRIVVLMNWKRVSLAFYHCRHHSDEAHSLYTSTQAVSAEYVASESDLDCRPDRKEFVFLVFEYHFAEQPSEQNDGERLGNHI